MKIGPLAILSRCISSSIWSVFLLGDTSSAFAITPDEMRSVLNSRQCSEYDAVYALPSSKVCISGCEKIEGNHADEQNRRFECMVTCNKQWTEDAQTINRYNEFVRRYCTSRKDNERGGQANSEVRDANKVNIDDRIAEARRRASNATEVNRENAERQAVSHRSALEKLDNEIEASVEVLREIERQRELEQQRQMQQLIELRRRRMEYQAQLQAARIEQSRQAFAAAISFAQGFISQMQVRRSAPIYQSPSFSPGGGAQYRFNDRTAVGGR